MTSKGSQLKGHISEYHSYDKYYTNLNTPRTPHKGIQNQVNTKRLQQKDHGMESDTWSQSLVWGGSEDSIMCLRSNFTLGNMAVRSTPEERHVL